MILGTPSPHYSPRSQESYKTTYKFISEERESQKEDKLETYMEKVSSMF